MPLNVREATTEITSILPLVEERLHTAVVIFLSKLLRTFKVFFFISAIITQTYFGWLLMMRETFFFLSHASNVFQWRDFSGAWTSLYRLWQWMGLCHGYIKKRSLMKIYCVTQTAVTRCSRQLRCFIFDPSMRLRILTDLWKIYWRRQRLNTRDLLHWVKPRVFVIREYSSLRDAKYYFQFNLISCTASRGIWLNKCASSFTCTVFNINKFRQYLCSAFV